MSRILAVKHGPYHVRYSERRAHKPSDLGEGASFIRLPNYRQHDWHSCGFVAALTVLHYLGKTVSPKDVLKAVRPTKSAGIDSKPMVTALRRLGVKAEYRGDLTVRQLRKHVADGTPVMLTVWPPDWVCDHWTVVRGFTKDKVWLSNYRSIPVRVFVREWFERGVGIVCRPGR